MSIVSMPNRQSSDTVWVATPYRLNKFIVLSALHGTFGFSRMAGLSAEAARYMPRQRNPEAAILRISLCWHQPCCGCNGPMQVGYFFTAVNLAG
ncbi:MAG: hypothetical protein NC095_05305 [Muribaculum sp.]|nr:hypothetical protein [Muribaculum sp.]